MRFVTAEQMREIDRHAIVNMGIPSAALMENAGRAIAEEVLGFCRERRQQTGEWSRQWSVDQAAAERIYEDGWDIGANKPLQAFGPDTRESGPDTETEVTLPFISLRGRANRVSAWAGPYGETYGMNEVRLRAASRLLGRFALTPEALASWARRTGIRSIG